MCKGGGGTINVFFCATHSCTCFWENNRSNELISSIGRVDNEIYIVASGALVFLNHLLLS